jgi:protein SCO1/2
MTERSTRLLLMVAAFAAGLASVLAIVLFVASRGPAPLVATASAVGGPFNLIDHNGKPLTHENMKGHPFLVFFGFTHCPDVCPTTLFDVSEVLKQLGPDAGGARALFVTVDPERDTPAIMKDYLSNFDPNLMGATGSRDAIDKTLKAYRVYSKKVPTEGSDYTMDHTALVYLMDKQGRFVAPFSLKRRPEEAAADLRRYL